MKILVLSTAVRSKKKSFLLAFDLTFKAFDPSAITQVQHAVQLLVKQVQISGGGDKICIVGLPTTKKLLQY